MQSFVLHEISEDKVKTSLNNVKTHTAHGFDHISAKFIKTAACVLTPFLTRIFNRCVEQETFLNDYKIAFVVPIPKFHLHKHLATFDPFHFYQFFLNFLKR